MVLRHKPSLAASGIVAFFPDKETSRLPVTTVEGDAVIVCVGAYSRSIPSPGAGKCRRPRSPRASVASRIIELVGPFLHIFESMIEGPVGRTNPRAGAGKCRRSQLLSVGITTKRHRPTT
jgi:hypothetical protein